MRSRQEQRELRIAGGLTLALVVGLASIWTRQGPPPHDAFAMIMGYFVAIAIWGGIEGLLLTRRRPPTPPTDFPESPTSPPEPPPEPSRVGALLGPRKPAPLVAHANPNGASA